MAEFWANTAASGNQPTGDAGDWTMGEKIGPVTRYMNKPSTNGKGADYWSGCLHAEDPHFANGPANHFFYYLSTGVPTTGSNASPYLPGGMAGITRAKAEKIWFRTLRDYMTASTRYIEARQATLNAARDIYGNPSTEYTAVNNAWIAVNVTSQSVPAGGCSPQGHGPYPF
jgi:zinc metalloprotease ZmpA